MANNEPKRLYISETDKKLAGVCGGIAEYLNVDSTIVRLLAVLVTVLTGGGGILGYIVMAVIMPKPPENKGPVEK